MTRHLCDRLGPHFQVFEILVDGARLRLQNVNVRAVTNIEPYATTPRREGSVQHKCQQACLMP